MSLSLSFLLSFPRPLLTFLAVIARLDPSLFACLLFILDQLHILYTARGHRYSYNANGVIINGKQRIGKMVRLGSLV